MSRERKPAFGDKMVKYDKKHKKSEKCNILWNDVVFNRKTVRNLSNNCVLFIYRDTASLLRIYDL